MDSITLSWVDYLLFCLVFGVSCVLGLYFGCFGNRQETKTEYLFGGRQMSIIPIATSLIASTLSSTSLLGIPTEIYLYGSQFVMVCVSMIISGLCTNYLFLPVFYKLKLTTMYQYLELRFNVYVRTSVSVIYIIDCLTMMTLFVYASALAINQMTGFELHLIAITLSTICIFYTALGGLRGVVWINTLQFFITACTLFCVIIMGTIAVGGWSQIWEKGKIGKRLEFFNVDPDPTLRNTLWSVVIGNTFIWINTTATNPSLIQQLLAVPNLSSSRKTLSAFVMGSIVTRTLCCFVGIIIFAKYFSCDPLSAGHIKQPDQIFPFYVLDIAAKTPGISGLFIATTFTTAMSSLSTLTNSLSGIIYIDFVEKFLPIKMTERRASNTMKGIAILLGVFIVLFIFVVEHLGTLLQLMVSFSGIVAGPSVGIVTLGVLFPVANAKGAISGATIAILVMSFIVTGHYINKVDDVLEYLPLETSTCNITTSLDTLARTTRSMNHTSEPLWIYRVSFHYYGFLSTTITIVVGLIVSWITNKNTETVNLDYLSPISSCLAKRKSKRLDSKVKAAEIQNQVTEPFLTEAQNS